MRNKPVYQTSLYYEGDCQTLYELVANQQDCIFLDSSKKESPYSHFSMIGVNPFLVIKYEDNKTYQKTDGGQFEIVQEARDFLTYLSDKIALYKVDFDESLPMTAGTMGYFSYDYGMTLEGIVPKQAAEIKVPDAYFVFYDNLIIMNHKDNCVTITGIGQLGQAKASVNSLKMCIENAILKVEDINIVKGNCHNCDNDLHFKSPFTKAHYMDAVEHMRDYIRSGDIYIANMTHTFTSDFQGLPINYYRQLRQVNPAPFAAYLPLEDFTILSSSPERFLSVRQGKVTTRPIKGTIPRGKTPEEDSYNRTVLSESEKDKSELLMIVDLERNDLSKICQPHSVKVPELFKIEAYATVFHLVSTIEGKLKDNHSAIDCFRAAYPGGSITGAPKIRAMEVIDELEVNNRNIYTGALGYFGFEGSADFNIIIRTILVKDQKAHIGVGGGITWESKAEAEYEETLAKGKALFKAMKATYKV